MRKLLLENKIFGLLVKHKREKVVKNKCICSPVETTHKTIIDPAR